jgi:hypothetical protein
MSRGVCVLSRYPAIDRLLQIIEIGVKPVDGLRFGCFSSGLEILKSVTQIGMAIFETGKVGIARGSFANALDFLPEFLGSIVECKVPGHLRYRSRDGGVWQRSIRIVILGMISQRGAAQEPLDEFSVCSYSESSVFDIVDRSKYSALVAPDARADAPACARINFLRKVVSRVCESDTPTMTGIHFPLDMGWIARIRDRRRGDAMWSPAARIVAG